MSAHSFRWLQMSSTLWWTRNENERAAISPSPLPPSPSPLVFLMWGSIFILYRLPWRLSGKESTCIAGDDGSIPGSGRSPEEGNVNPLQYSYLGNPHGQRSLVGYRPWGCKRKMTQLSDWTTKFILCKGRGRSQAVSLPVLNVQFARAWSRVYPPVSPRAPSPSFSCLAFVTLWVYLWLLSVPQQRQKSLPLLSCVSSFSFGGGGSVGRCAGRVALQWKDKREKSQMHLPPVR